jgi:hypothetical protein
MMIYGYLLRAELFHKGGQNALEIALWYSGTEYDVKYLLLFLSALLNIYSFFIQTLP